MRLPPLAGYRVVDLSQGAAGPFCSMLLGDMGAEIIKIEPIQGDWLRKLGPPFQKGESPFFLALNRNKKGMAIDIKKEKGKRIISKFLENSQCFLENYRPGVMKNLGLDYDSIKAINPKIVYCSISGFGQKGPWREKPALDIVAQGMSGLMSVTGTEDGRPIRVGVPISDMLAGLYAFQGMVLGLLVLERTGIGQYIETSLLDATISVQAHTISMYFATGQTPKPLETGFHILVPAQCFRAKDGFINLSVRSEDQWPKFCEAIGRRDLINHPKFCSNEKRVKNRAELIPILQEIFPDKTVEEWLVILEERDIICGPLYTYDKLFNDPQVTQYNKMLLEINHPTAGLLKTLGIPIKFTQTPGTVKSSAPLLGQDTKGILLELGYGKEEIDFLEKEKVIKCIQL
jgi:crotonobetainyl-CoA:carnitine CoA-transferase CaiB-like acyl-CoA transferase